MIPAIAARLKACSRQHCQSQNPPFTHAKLPLSIIRIQNLDARPCLKTPHSSSPSSSQPATRSNPYPPCLESLITQSDEAFRLGRDWQLILVDDDSTDATPRLFAEAAAAHPGIIAISAPALDPTHLTGKNNACWAGAKTATGTLLLFTDADTLHTPGSLSRARHELEKYGVALLSYSPQQLTIGFIQRITMPLIFAELAIAYPPTKVSDPASRIAAANGQFILVEADAYFASGGHKALGTNVLEDVQLAHNIKRTKSTIRFRYASDALATNMYRTTTDFIEGWTKNLALLFGSPVLLALLRLLDLLLIVVIPVIALVYPFALPYQRILLWLVWARVLWRFYSRTAKSNFPALEIALSVLGLPVIIFLLIRSYFHIRITKRIAWKGRIYKPAVR